MAQNIVITGGSSGIGKGIAKYFYGKGWQVLITGRNMEKLKQAEEEIAALNMLTKIWALELAPKGIRVNAIAPGPTDTDILRSSGFDDAAIKEIHLQERDSIPLKRRGLIDDIVCNAGLLLDSGSNWTTGVVLATDGGVSIS